MATSDKSRSLSPEQKASVREELAFILASADFSGSKRCSDFLEYVVTHFLEGDIERLAERFLGAELYGKPVDYETATDSVVRVRGSDVRRRLMQHYAKHQPVAGVIMELPPGSYIPRFHWTSDDPEILAGTLPKSPLADPEVTSTQTGLRHLLSSKRLLIGLATLLVFAISAASWYWHRSASSSDTALERFWSPVLQNKKDVTICFGDTRSYWPDPEARSAIDDEKPISQILINKWTATRDDQTTAGNIRAALSIMDALNRHGLRAHIKWPQELEPSETAQSNVVFIGAFNNLWTTSLNRELRFSFSAVQTATGFKWMILDKRNADRSWSTTATYPQAISEDFALITRIIDPNQKRVEIAIGGLNMFGTQAAGELLDDESWLESFARTAPKGWEKRNIQIVLAMEVSQRKVVHPRIVATEVW